MEGDFGQNLEMAYTKREMGHVQYKVGCTVYYVHVHVYGDSLIMLYGEMAHTMATLQIILVINLSRLIVRPGSSFDLTRSQSGLTKRYFHHVFTPTGTVVQQ